MHRITLPLASLAYLVMMSALPGNAPAWVNTVAGIVGIALAALAYRRYIARLEQRHRDELERAREVFWGDVATTVSSALQEQEATSADRD